MVLLIAEGDCGFLVFIPPSFLNNFCGGQAGKPGKTSRKSCLPRRSHAFSVTKTGKSCLKFFY
jgi:hypothetical protein